MLALRVVGGKSERGGDGDAAISEIADVDVRLAEEWLDGCCSSVALTDVKCEAVR